MPEKGNVTKLECSKIETEKAIFVFSQALKKFCPSVFPFVSHLVPLKLQNV